jgi:hypothetical protein
MRVVLVSKVWHIYWIPMGGGKPIGYESTCTSCGTMCGYGVEQYLGFVNDGVCDMEMVRQTNPNLMHFLTERKELEDRVYTSNATHNERLSLIWEVIQSLEYVAEKRMKKGHAESITAVTALFLIIAVFGAVICASLPKSCLYANAWYIAIGVLFVALIYRMTVSTRRARQRAVLGLLADGLASLDPTYDELAEVLKSEKKSALFKSLKPEQIIEAIDARLAEFSSVSAAHPR